MRPLPLSVPSRWLRLTFGPVFWVLLLGTALAATDAVSRDGRVASGRNPRKPAPALSSLPAPRAAGPLRILLVDDDWSANNGTPGNPSLSASDEIFRTLVAQAVGGDAKAWSVEVAPNYDRGPGLERLREFNVVIWYNGGSYGGNPDHSSVLSLDDEKVARRYLEETGGSFILISPGYVGSYSYGNTWKEGRVPFLNEVVGINGFRGMVKRFAAGEVSAPDGTTFVVEARGPVEPLFSTLNPDGAAVVFSSLISLPGEEMPDTPVAVAVTHPYGAGRFTHVAFSFENIGDDHRPRAFAALLAAAGTSPSPATQPPVATGSKGTPAPLTPFAGDATSTGAAKSGDTMAVANKPLPPTGTTGAAAIEPQVALPPRNIPIQLDPAVTPTASAVTTRSAALPDSLKNRQSEFGGRSLNAPEPGPAPRNVTVEPKGVGVQLLRWNGELNSTYEVFRKNGDTWQSLASGINQTMWFEDHSFVPPGTTYRLVANYPDNRIGSAEVTLPNPMMPAPPTDISLRQTAEGTLTISLRWNVRDYDLQGFQVMVATGNTNTGKFLDKATSGSGSLTFSSLPRGPATVRVVPRYDGKLAPVESVRTATMEIWSARYRIILLGFKVVGATKDEDIFSGDGAGDEVFFGAYRALVTRDRKQVDSLGAVRSRVYGDNGRFTDRIRAGSASATGGLRDGDIVPSAALLNAQPRVAAQADRLPMLLWDGTLTKGASALILGLVGFEWDNSSDAGWVAWRDYWTSPANVPLLADAALSRISIGGAFLAASGRFPITERLVCSGTRPLTIINLDAKAPKQFEFTPEGLVFTQEQLEVKLSGGTITTMTVRWRAAAKLTSSGYDDFSDYEIHLQLERMAP